MSRPHDPELDVIVLAGKLGALTQGVNDTIVLAALLSLYAAIALNSNCCTYGAVNGLLAVAEDIAGTQAAGMNTDIQTPRTETFPVH